MEQEKIEGLLIDYIDGRLNAAENEEVERMISLQPEVEVLYQQLKIVIKGMEESQQLEPGEKMKSGFELMLSVEINSIVPKKGKQLFFQPMIWRAAAVIALVVSGIAIGYWINRNNTNQNEMLAIRKELEATKQMMMVMLQNPQSASQRMQGVSVALTISNVDDEVVKALVHTLNKDKNVNVRLAAMEALAQFQQEPAVRKALTESLALQESPVIQIALIQLLVKMKEKGIVDDLNRIIKDIHTIDAVKDEAYTGLLKLS